MGSKDLEPWRLIECALSPKGSKYLWPDLIGSNCLNQGEKNEVQMASWVLSLLFNPCLAFQYCISTWFSIYFSLFCWLPLISCIYIQLSRISSSVMTGFQLLCQWPPHVIESVFCTPVFISPLGHSDGPFRHILFKAECLIASLSIHHPAFSTTSYTAAPHFQVFLWETC